MKILQYVWLRLDTKPAQRTMSLWNNGLLIWKTVKTWVFGTLHTTRSSTINLLRDGTWSVLMDGYKYTNSKLIAQKMTPTKCSSGKKHKLEMSKNFQPKRFCRKYFTLNLTNELNFVNCFLKRFYLYN